ncbi:MAG: HEAT repeat domain-containing protein [Zavarzinella sp.]
MMRKLLIFTLLTAGGLPSTSPAYIAVQADRLTLCEVMLEFPTIVVLEMQKGDPARGAYLFDIKEVLQGPAPKQPVRFSLLEDGKVPSRIGKLAKSQQIVAFMGSPDNRSLIVTAGGWFLTQPNQGWERFSGFRDDFRSLFAGTPTQLIEAIRSLKGGGIVTVEVHPKGLGEKERLLIRYDSDYPHRRWPTLPRGFSDRTIDTLRKEFNSSSVVVRQQAMLAAAKFPTLEENLRAGMRDPHTEVRLAAIVSLGDLPALTAETMKELTRCLNDEDRFVCAMAAWRLGRLGPVAKSTIPELLKALNDRDANYDFRPHRAAEAAEAILAIAPDSDAAPKAVQFFLSNRMLNDHRIDSEGTRTAAARALGRSGKVASAALPDLTAALKDKLPATRIAAAEAVHLIGGDEKPREFALAVLQVEISKGELATRIQAIRAAANIRATTLRPALQKFLNDPALKVHIAEALQRLEK